MHNNNNVAILLSTYNGEKYLSSQLDSILCQSYKNWVLYIRDDGSTDNTVEIIRTYKEQYPNIIFIEDSIAHRGIRESFIFLLEHATGDFFMFCDQDDVWLEQKIELSIKSILRLPQQIPLLIATDLYIVDKSLNVISNSMWTYCKMLHKVRNLKYLEVTDYLTGCTMCFNYIAKSKILELNRTINHNYLHDQLTTLAILHNKGQIDIIETATILYRQHDRNVIGGTRIENKCLYRIKNILNIIRHEFERFLLAHRIFKTSLFRFLSLRIESIRDK